MAPTPVSRHSGGTDIGSVSGHNASILRVEWHRCGIHSFGRFFCGDTKLYHRSEQTMTDNLDKARFVSRRLMIEAKLSFRKTLTRNKPRNRFRYCTRPRMTHSSKVRLHGRRRINVRWHHFHHESRFLKGVIAVRAEYNCTTSPIDLNEPLALQWRRDALTP